MNAEECIAELRAMRLTLAVAESCTGGLLATTITDVAGCSDVFMGGVVSYSNASKTALLGVDAALIETHGAVSEAVAKSMAEGALVRFGANVALSTTGIAGPSGGTAEKPVGLVYIGIATPDGTRVEKHFFSGTREDIRRQTVYSALASLEAFSRSAKLG